MEKSFKLTKAIQIILITILLIVIAIIAVGKLSNNETIATDSTSECSSTETVTGDVTGDGKVDFKDIVKINRYRLNKITEL